MVMSESCLKFCETFTKHWDFMTSKMCFKILPHKVIKTASMCDQNIAFYAKQSFFNLKGSHFTKTEFALCFSAEVVISFIMLNTFLKKLIHLCGLAPLKS